MAHDTQDLIDPIDGDPTLTTHDDDADASALAIDDGKGNKMVPLSALVGAKKELRALGKKVKELEPVAARATELDERLTRAQPIIDALVTSPKLRAEALRIAQGTNVSSDRTAQPSEEDDPDATSTAEDLGFYLSDGVTPDVARARRVLNRLDQRHGRQTDERIRPFAGVALNQRAEANLREAAAATDEDGVPLATIESIKEVARDLPQHLLADPKVIDLVLNSAIGVDRRKRRTPKAAEEPMYLERQGGNRRSAEPTISPDERRNLERLGLTEKEYTASTKRLEQGVASRRSIVLGS